MQKSLVGLLAVSLLAGCGAHVGPVLTARTAGATTSKAVTIPNLTGAEIFKQLDANQDGKLSLPEFQQLGIFGVNGRLFDPSKPTPPLPQMQAVTFQSFDKDHDQAVSSAEFENFGVALQYATVFSSPSEFYTTMFPTLDLDHDGRLTEAEWEQMGIFGVNSVSAGPDNPTPSLQQLQALTFKLYDRNQDGALTQSELTF